MPYSERILDSTKPGKLFLLLVFLFLLTAISAIGQTKEEQKMRIKAVKAIRSQKFDVAQNIYTDLLKLHPDNPDYNYEMGLAIYEAGIHRGEATKYLEKAIQNTVRDTLPDMYLFAGKSEQYAGDFDIAIDYFKTYVRLMAKEATEDPTANAMVEDISRYIQMCENGKVQFENNKNFIRIENMGDSINSAFPDYSPVVTNDESVILFTSRRENSTGGSKDNDDQYFEDVYYSVNKNGIYSKASNKDAESKYINAQLNTPAHDATITYSAGETQLFIYRDLDVWVSTYENGAWTVPTKAQGRINSEKGFEPSVFITQDQKIMFVVSDISAGYGGRDIYMTTKDEYGQWKTLTNLGKGINTKFDEDAPFLTPDGNTLYFASTGHNSIGDYDIFKTELNENGNWGPVENLGPPINTPGHDRYFVTSDDGAVGYYSSDRDGGFGETDIYRIILDCKSVSATLIRGIVFSEDLHKPIATKITIFDPKTNVIINTYKSDSLTGKYEMRLKTETKYGFKIDAEGYMTHTGEFTVPKQCDYFSLFQEIRIENIEDENGQVIAQRAFINNAFFDVDSKMKEDYSAEIRENMVPDQMDSLRSVVVKNYDPIELTNLVRMIDIVDPNGIKLATEIIGDIPVAEIQTNDETEYRYDEKIKVADNHFNEKIYPEARANYLIASEIKPDEMYPKNQVIVIDGILKDQPFQSNFATIPENDNSRLIVPQLIDSSQFRNPSAPIAAAKPADIKPTPIKEVKVTGMESKEPVIASTENPESRDNNIAAIATKEVAIEEVKVEDNSITEGETPTIEKTLVNTDAEPAKVEEVATVVVEPKQEAIATVEPKKPEPAKTPQVEEKKAPKSAVSGDETIVFRNILFDFDKSELRPESVAELNKVTEYMTRKTQVEVQVDGHADWMGSQEYNMALSERRAKTASSYIVDNGVSENRVSYQFFGESVPIAPNANADGTDNPAGRQLNRRCEFKIDQTGTADNVVLKF